MIINSIHINPSSKACSNKQSSAVPISYNINLPACDTFTPSVSFQARIHRYAKRNNLAGVLRELNRGVDINLRTRSMDTALIMASNNRAVEVVKELLKHPDIDVNAQCVTRKKERNTALILASNKGYYDVAEELLKHPNVNLSIRDECGMTALDWAIEEGYEKIAEIIREYVPGVDRRDLPPEPENPSDENVETLIIPSSSRLVTELTSTDPFVKNMGFEDLIKFIDSDQFNPNYKDDIGRNVIQLSMLSRDERIKTIISKALIKGVDINAQNDFGQTALMTAIKNLITAEDDEERIVDLSVIKFILDQTPDIDIQDKNKQSAYHLACMSTSAPLLTMILSRDPNILLRDVKGKRGSNYFKTDEMKEVYQNFIKELTLK